MEKSNPNFPRFDRLNMGQDKKILEKLKNNNKNEFVILSTKIEKFNHVNKC